MSHRLCAARAGLDFRAWREAGGGAEAPSSCRSSFLTPPGNAALSLLPFSPSPGPFPALPASGPTSCFRLTGGVSEGEGGPPTLEGALHSQLRQSKSCPLWAQAWSLASAVRQSPEIRVQAWLGGDRTPVPYLAPRRMTRQALPSMSSVEPNMGVRPGSHPPTAPQHLRLQRPRQDQVELSPRITQTQCLHLDMSLFF